MLHEYQIVGRKIPTSSDPTPQLYKMRIFASNTVVAKSRYWYFLSSLKKMKRSAGEIIAINEIHSKNPLKVKNFGIWLRYNSRSGTHNMYKEYREMNRADAVEACYKDMAARHRTRFRDIHIIKVSELTTAQIRRPYIQQLIDPKLKFPMPHRVARAFRPIFAGRRPTTHA